MPPTVATVGSQYTYCAQAAYVCGIIPLTCGKVVGVQLPPGAAINSNYITWTPGVDQANRDARFVIATEADVCGHRVTQSWAVHVYPAPAGSGG